MFSNELSRKISDRKSKLLKNVAVAEKQNNMGSFFLGHSIYREYGVMHYSILGTTTVILL